MPLERQIQVADRRVGELLDGVGGRNGGPSRVEGRGKRLLRLDVSGEPLHPVAEQGLQLALG